MLISFRKMIVCQNFAEIMNVMHPTNNAKHMSGGGSLQADPLMKRRKTKEQKLATAVFSFLDLSLCCLRWDTFHTLFEYRVNIINWAAVASFAFFFCRPFLLFENGSCCRLGERRGVLVKILDFPQPKRSRAYLACSAVQKIVLKDDNICCYNRTTISIQQDYLGTNYKMLKSIINAFWLYWTSY